MVAVLVKEWSWLHPHNYRAEEGNTCICQDSSNVHTDYLKKRVLYMQYAQHTIHDSAKRLDYIQMYSVLRFFLKYGFPLTDVPRI